MGIKKAKCDGLTDEEIVIRSLKDLEYFSCIYDRYGPRLLLYINKISSVNHEEAEDILQESFIKIWRNLNEYDHSLKLSSWLYRIVHNDTISYNRKKHSYGKDNILELSENQIEDFYAEIDLEEDPEYKFVITNKILNSLAIKYKECLILKYFEMMSYEEISDILKIPEGTVAIRINRAKKMFKNIAEKEHISFKQ